LKAAVVVVAVLLMALGLGAPVSRNPSPGRPQGAGGSARVAQVVPDADSPVPVVRLPGDTRPFSSYDFNKTELTRPEWPVEFVFRGDATVAGIEDGLCRLSSFPWKYCASGSNEFLYSPSDPGDLTFESGDYLASGGVKRFSETCADTQFTAHMRLYPLLQSGGVLDAAPAGADAAVVGTVHLDYEDRGGCSGSKYGYPDVAEQWFEDAMRTVPGWTITPDAWNLHNGSAPYVVLDRQRGIVVPYVYGQDSLATDVYIDGR
jgi:hypothetical protein